MSSHYHHAIRAARHNQSSVARGGAAFDEADTLPLILERTCRCAEVSPTAILALLFRLWATGSGTNSNSERKPRNRDRRDYTVRRRVDDDDRRVETLLACCISAGAVRRDGNIVDQKTRRDSGNHGIGRGVNDGDRTVLVRHVCAGTVRGDRYAAWKEADRNSGNHSIARDVDHQDRVVIGIREVGARTVRRNGYAQN